MFLKKHNSVVLAEGVPLRCCNVVCDSIMLFVVCIVMQFDYVKCTFHESLRYVCNEGVSTCMTNGDKILSTTFMLFHVIRSQIVLCVTSDRNNKNKMCK